MEIVSPQIGRILILFAVLIPIGGGIYYLSAKYWFKIDGITVAESMLISVIAFIAAWLEVSYLMLGLMLTIVSSFDEFFSGNNILLAPTLALLISLLISFMIIARFVCKISFWKAFKSGIPASVFLIVVFNLISHIV